MADCGELTSEFPSVSQAPTGVGSGAIGSRQLQFFGARGFICGMFRLTFPTLLAALLLLIGGARADVALPKNILEPATVSEAWNVIGLARKNVEALISEKRADEIAIQISLCSPSLRTLVRLAPSPTATVSLDGLTVRAFNFINIIAAGGIANDLPRVEAGYSGFSKVVGEMAALFDEKTVKSEIYYCPTHPETISTDRSVSCEKCRERLVPRRIPYSFIYTAPRELTLRAAARTDAPLGAGQQARVTLTLTHLDGSPVVPNDLLITHGHRMHLLIVDPSLADFQRQHPQPTDTPGEYTFQFTPRLAAPYRVWVDVTPAATGLAEFPIVELPSSGPPQSITPLGDDRTAFAGGLKLLLSFDDRQGTRPRERETRLMRLTVTRLASQASPGEKGEPMDKLEPYLKAFAHLTGLYDDGKTLIRLHPEGGELQRDDLRGGPVIAFRIYPPKAGRIRFFCEVMADGKLIVAPIEVGISPN